MPELSEMNLTKLRLQNFRNYQAREFAFSEKTTIILGPNTSGKTNLLEAICLLATGKSFHAELEQEMITWGEEIGRVKGRIVKDKEKTDLEIILTRGLIGGEKVARKKYLANGVSRRMTDFLGQLRAVYFGPEDLALVTNSPSSRRRYLDSVLVQVDREYTRSLLSYEKGLRQRNKLLERIREEGISRSQLLFWDQLLIRNGEMLTQKREEFIDFINNFSGEAGSHFVGRFSLEYDKSVISPARLEEYAEEEVTAGATLVGPHRDDFKFVIRDTKHETREKNDVSLVQSHVSHDLSLYGSRGEQRMAILWLKMCELEYIFTQAKERPILLLDDIFSELDHEHRKQVLEIIPYQQTLITAADSHLVEEAVKKKAEVIELK